MKKSDKFFTLSILIFAVSMGSASADPIARGEWETTARVATPQGTQVIRQKVCRRGEGVAELLLRQQGETCDPWKVSSGMGGKYDMQSTCTQSGPFPGGSLKMNVHAIVAVAPDGRSAKGTVQATGHVAGAPFTSPPTQFSSRYIGACPGR